MGSACRTGIAFTSIRQAATVPPSVQKSQDLLDVPWLSVADVTLSGWGDLGSNATALLFGNFSSALHVEVSLLISDVVEATHLYQTCHPPRLAGIVQQEPILCLWVCQDLRPPLVFLDSSQPHPLGGVGRPLIVFFSQLSIARTAFSLPLCEPIPALLMSMP